MFFRARGDEKASPLLSDYIEITQNRDFARINILSTGEMVNIDIPDKLLAPSEAHSLIEDLKNMKQKMENLRILS